MAEKTLKMAAKEAKARLKSGFWQTYGAEIARARANGVSGAEAIAYFSRTAEEDCRETAFYGKVKDILDRSGEVSDILGRLAEKERYETLDYAAKQRYMLELSDRYQRALARYKRERSLTEGKNSAC